MYRFNPSFCAKIAHLLPYRYVICIHVIAGRDLVVLKVCIKADVYKTGIYDIAPAVYGKRNLPRWRLVLPQKRLLDCVGSGG